VELLSYILTLSFVPSFPAGVMEARSLCYRCSLHQPGGLGGVCVCDRFLFSQSAHTVHSPFLLSF
jgi:hypothetical protein